MARGEATRGTEASKQSLSKGSRAALEPEAGESPALTAAPTGWRRTFSSLQNPHFRLLWWGLLFSYLAFSMSILARGYLAYKLAGPLALGYVSLGRGVPMLALALVGGVIADRVDKRWMLIRTQTTLGILGVIAALLVQTDLIQIWHLVLISALEGVVFAFNLPARQSLIPELVGERHVTNAIALSNAGMHFTRTFGPALAGILIGVPFIGLSGVFYLIAVSYSVNAFTMIQLPGTYVGHRASSSMQREMMQGVQHILARPALATLIAMAFIPILIGMPYQQLLPAFAAEEVHVGSSGLGLLMAASGFGSLLGSLIVAYLADFPRKATLQLVGGVGFGLTLVVFGLSSNFGVALALIMAVGLMSNSYLALNNTLIMLQTDRQFYGRVMSVYMITWSLLPLSTMPVAALVEAIGPSATIAGTGAVVAVLIGAIALFLPSYRRSEVLPST